MYFWCLIKSAYIPSFILTGLKSLNPASKIEQIAVYLKAKSFVPVVYPGEALFAAKPDHLLYYKTGTHWTHIGELIQVIGSYLRGLKVIFRH